MSQGNKMKDSCLCEAVAYETDNIDLPVAHWHYRTCQKAHAAPFAVTAVIMREHFRRLKGDEGMPRHPERQLGRK